MRWCALHPLFSIIFDVDHFKIIAPQLIDSGTSNFKTERQCLGNLEAPLGKVCDNIKFLEDCARNQILAELCKQSRGNYWQKSVMRAKSRTKNFLAKLLRIS